VTAVIAFEETNCYWDVVAGLLRRIGRDPAPLGAVAFTADHLGSQWTFLKPDPRDLRELAGLDVQEFPLWQPLREQLLEELARGRWLLFETDAWFLPDTVGLTYQHEHDKTSILALTLDEAGLHYLHNTSTAVATGTDLAGILGERPETMVPLPYVELVTALAAPGPESVRDAGIAALRTHLGRRPAGNPVARLADAVRLQLPLLAERDSAWFHRWSFANLRQLGVSAQAAADVVRWAGAADLAPAFVEVATCAKSLQYVLARVNAGRRADPDELLDRACSRWESGVADTLRRFA
jgi:hypothetical protein